jgi:hypothetical protein
MSRSAKEFIRTSSATIIFGPKTVACRNWPQRKALADLPPWLKLVIVALSVL